MVGARRVRSTSRRRRSRLIRDQRFGGTPAGMDAHPTGLRSRKTVVRSSATIEVFSTSSAGFYPFVRVETLANDTTFGTNGRVVLLIEDDVSGERAVKIARLTTKLDPGPPGDQKCNGVVPSTVQVLDSCIAQYRMECCCGSPSFPTPCYETPTRGHLFQRAGSWIQPFPTSPAEEVQRREVYALMEVTS